MKTSETNAFAHMNRAADDVLEALEPLPDEGVRDIVNLIVNVSAYYMKNPGVTLEDAIRDRYQEEPETVLGWCNAA